jgi:hypothetical protein
MSDIKEPDQIDLMPKDWESDREKPAEPIFGPGLPGALAWFISFVIVFTITYHLRH